MSPQERFEELKGKKLCCQCLTPGLKFGHVGKCFDKYKCPDDSHKHFDSGLHVLVCDKHKNKPENLDLLQAYKTKCIIGANDAYSDFSKNIDIAFHLGIRSDDVERHESANDDVAIFMFQTIQVGNRRFNLFFDSGCGGAVIRKSAVDFLTNRGLAKNIGEGPLILS